MQLELFITPEPAEKAGGPSGFSAALCLWGRERRVSDAMAAVSDPISVYTV